MQDAGDKIRSSREEEQLKKLKSRTEIDSYAECYPGYSICDLWISILLLYSEYFLLIYMILLVCSGINRQFQNSRFVFVF